MLFRYVKTVDIHFNRTYKVSVKAAAKYSFATVSWM
jgi:hypothetical protein